MNEEERSTERAAAKDTYSIAKTEKVRNVKRNSYGRLSWG